MFRKTLLILPLFAAILLVGQAAPTRETPKPSRPEYCLFVTVDALDRRYISPETTPNLVSWQKEGVVFPDDINVYPTVTTPNMTSILTGAYPLTTSIGSNIVFLKKERKVVAGPRFNKAVTIAEVFHDAGFPTAVVQHFMLKDRGADQYFQIEDGSNDKITAKALDLLNGKTVPRLLAVLYQKVDTIGHRYGRKSTQVHKVVHDVDGQIAHLIDEYRKLGILDRTLVIVSADHGMSDKDKQINIALLRKKITEGGWKYQTLTPKTVPDPSVDFYHIQEANMQCYFNRPFTLEERNRLFDAIRSVPGIGAIFDSTALKRMHCHPDAGDFIVEPAPGYWFGGKGGVHGRNTESDPYLLMFGPGMRKGVRVEGAENVDIVPTVLHLMNLPCPHTVDGKVLWEALAP